MKLEFTHKKSSPEEAAFSNKPLFYGSESDSKILHYGIGYIVIILHLF